MGVLGFALSLILAISEIKRRWHFLRVYNVKLVPMNNGQPEAFVYVRCTIENPSSIQVPLTSISIKVPGIRRLTAIREETVLFEQRNLKRGLHAEYTNTPLPINLAPCSAEDIVAVFRLKECELPKSLRHPGGNSRPERESIWIRLDLARGSVSLPRYRRAVVADYEVEGENVLSHARMHS